MKRSELKQLIKEEINNILEQSDYDIALSNLAKKAGIVKSTGGNKFRMPKKIEIVFSEQDGRYYRTIVDGKTNAPGFFKASDTERFIKSATGLDVSLSRENELELESIKSALAKNGIEFVWSEYDLS